MPQTPTLNAPHQTTDAVEPYRQSTSSLRANIRRLQRVLDWELDSHEPCDHALALEAELIEERHALALAEMILRIRLGREGN